MLNGIFNHAFLLSRHLNHACLGGGAHKSCLMYRIAGSFRGRKLSQIDEKYDFYRENFCGLLTCAVPKDATPPNFAEKTFANSHKSFSLKSFPLYGISLVQSVTSSLPLTLVTRMHTCTRSESHAVPSPHHLSWLALDAYKALFRNEEVRYILVAVFPVLFSLVACSTELQAASYM